MEDDVGGFPVDGAARQGDCARTGVATAAQVVGKERSFLLMTYFVFSTGKTPRSLLTASRKKRHIFVNFEARDRKKDRQTANANRGNGDNRADGGGGGGGVGGGDGHAVVGVSPAARAARRGRRTSDVRITVSLPQQPEPAARSAAGECVKLGRLLWRDPEENRCDSPRCNENLILVHLSKFL